MSLPGNLCKRLVLGAAIFWAVKTLMGFQIVARRTLRLSMFAVITL